MAGFYLALLFFLVGFIIVGITLVVSGVLHPKKDYPEKYIPYECGELPVGKAWIRFNNHFYIFAIIFIIFDVEVLFMFPWAVVFDHFGMLAFVEMLIFIAILLVGLAYVWAKGDLSWVKPRPHLEHLAKKKGAK
jgi:NADH-quinone oxidoreductase subunit A